MCKFGQQGDQEWPTTDVPGIKLVTLDQKM
jgi:hypothetical protein